MLSDKFLKQLLELDFREYKPPFSSSSDMTDRRFFQKKIITNTTEDDDLFLDVYIYGSQKFSNGNVFPGLIQFTSQWYTNKLQTSTFKITIDFKEGDSIEGVIDYVISVYDHNTMRT